MDGSQEPPRSGEQLMAAINEALEAEQSPRPPRRVRAGEIGKECAREIALGFLWTTEPESFDGRMLRLFGTGQVEEDRLIAWLRLSGMDVIDRDPDDPSKQLPVEALDGHFFGYMDGLALDRSYGGAWMVVECKTHNDKSYKNLQKNGIIASKPEHYGQMQSYMHLLGLKYALYVFKNKNTDEMDIKVVEYDEVYAERLMKKAEMIAGKRVLPAKIHQNPDDCFKCKFCKKKEVCTGRLKPLVNCRTCEHSRPVVGGKWACELHKCEIDNELMKVGCDSYELANMLNIMPS